FYFFFFSSRRRHTRFSRDWSSDVCSSDLGLLMVRLFALCWSIVLACVPVAPQRPAFDVAAFDRARVLKAANQYLSERPVTITARSEERRVGKECRCRGAAWKVRKMREMVV